MAAIGLAAGASTASAVTINYWAGNGIDSHAELNHDERGPRHSLTRNAARVLNPAPNLGVCVWTTPGGGGARDTAFVCAPDLAANGFQGTVLRYPWAGPEYRVFPYPDTRAKLDY